MDFKTNRLLEQIELINNIGKALSLETNTPRLLELILFGAKELTNADAGSLYILKNGKLNFEIVHTSSMDFYMGGTSGVPINFPSIPLVNPDGSPNLGNIVSTSVIEKRLINIPDVYQSSEFNFSGPRSFDQKTGYYSQSILVAPLLNHEGQAIGALQLINPVHNSTGEISTFTKMDEGLTSSLSSQAAIALTRKRLIDDLHELLHALVRLIATAIDEKSPHTAGHCSRVPLITMALAKAVNDDMGSGFKNVFFSSKQLEELEMAAWLHDCGKITTPEHVIDKSTKLESLFDRIELVDAHLEILRRDIVVEQLKSQLAGSCSDVVQQEYDERLSFLDECQELLRSSNKGSFFVDEKVRKKLDEIAEMEVRFSDGSVKPLLDENMLYNLSISRGTLTDEERQVINNHVNASIRMLKTLPFPEHLSQVADIAGGHHERVDGKGYPNGVTINALPIQTQILAIADIFEALTASDRVYRSPNKLSEALTIMANMCKGGHVDKSLFVLLLQSQAYQDFVKKELRPEQVDEVDVERILSLLEH